MGFLSWRGLASNMVLLAAVFALPVFCLCTPDVVHGTEVQDEFDLLVYGPLDSGEVFLVGNYQNNGEEPRNASMSLVFFLNGTKMAETETQGIMVDSGKGADLNFTYLGYDAGTYKIYAKIPGTNLSDVGVFSKNATEGGMAALVNSDSEQGAFLRARQSTRDSLLFLCVVILVILLYYNHRRISKSELELRRELV